MLEPFPVFAGKTLLVVDDFPPVAAFLHDVFSECGARVVTATTGRNAMIQAQLGAFDLVVLDLVMPKPDGWDVLEFLRRAAPALARRAILVTGDRYGDRTLRRRLHCDVPTVEKPFNVEYLRALAAATLLRASFETDPCLDPAGAPCATRVVPFHSRSPGRCGGPAGSALRAHRLRPASAIPIFSAHHTSTCRQDGQWAARSSRP